MTELVRVADKAKRPPSPAEWETLCAKRVPELIRRAKEGSLDPRVLNASLQQLLEGWGIEPNPITLQSTGLFFPGGVVPPYAVRVDGCEKPSPTQDHDGVIGMTSLSYTMGLGQFFEKPTDDVEPCEIGIYGVERDVRDVDIMDLLGKDNFMMLGATIIYAMRNYLWCGDRHVFYYREAGTLICAGELWTTSSGDWRINHYRVTPGTSQKAGTKILALVPRKYR